MLRLTSVNWHHTDHQHLLRVISYLDYHSPPISGPDHLLYLETRGIFWRRIPTSLLEQIQPRQVKRAVVNSF
jgi:hypothetical protein